MSIYTYVLKHYSAKVNIFPILKKAHKGDNMALPKDIAEDVEIAKGRLMQSSLDDNSKKCILRFLNSSATATNGVSIEEKIQKMSESLLGMVLYQIQFLDAVDKKIETANKEQCKDCKAMKLAVGVEEHEKHEILAGKLKNDAKDETKDENVSLNWS